MARAIDKQTMLDLIIEAKRAEPETGSFAEWLAEYLVEHLPTLTPPNEPLRCTGCMYLRCRLCPMCALYQGGRICRLLPPPAGGKGGCSDWNWQN